MSMKNIGYIVLALGLLIALAGLLADVIGLGNNPNRFGNQQLALVVIGLVAGAVGGYLAFIKPKAA